jgi:amidase
MLIKNDTFNAFVDYPDVSVTHAPNGPLEGLTFAVKDIFDVAGYPTGCGNPEKRAESEAHPPREHAPAVAVLLNAGAQFVGKTHTVELAFSLDGRNEHFGTPENPAAPGRVPGGSSSGSASAVAGGLVDFALGSDTAGSVRVPSSLCGIIGLRPTHGRIDISRTMPLAPSLDTVGWFAQSPETFERVGVVLLGDDIEGPALSRMIVAEDTFALLAGAAEDAVLRPAVERIAAHVKSSHALVVAPDGLAAWAEVVRVIQGFEAWQSHGDWITDRKPNLTPPVRGRFEAASKVTAEAHQAATAMRSRIRNQVSEIIGDDGILVLPSAPTTAPRVNAAEADFEAFRTQALQMLCISGLCGFPQISLPVGQTENGPIGISLIAPAGRDRAIVALARRILES